jgi:hypothetical protein
MYSRRLNINTVFNPDVVELSESSVATIATIPINRTVIVLMKVDIFGTKTDRTSTQVDSDRTKQLYNTIYNN